jgi:hypothetical protein
VSGIGYPVSRSSSSAECRGIKKGEKRKKYGAASCELLQIADCRAASSEQSASREQRAASSDEQRAASSDE